MPCLFINTIDGQLDINNGTVTSDTFPFVSSANYSQSATIYSTSSLSTIAGKTITAISFYFLNYNPGYNIINQTLKLSHTSSSTFPSSVTANTYSPLTLTNTTTVKSNFNWTFTSLGWYKFEFDTPFVYNGLSNLLVSWENRDGTSAGGFGIVRGVSSLNKQFVISSDGGYPTWTSSTIPDFSPNTQIFYY